MDKEKQKNIAAIFLLVGMISIIIAAFLTSVISGLVILGVCLIILAFGATLAIDEKES